MAQPVAANINVHSTISHLNKSFGNTIQKLCHVTGIRTPVPGTEAYKFQVEYSYLINDVSRAPQYIVPKHVQNVHDLICKIETRIEELKDSE